MQRAWVQEEAQGYVMPFLPCVRETDPALAQRITVQGYAESACLGNASTNQTTLDLSFEVFQTNIQQCEKSFNMSWDLTPAARPP